MKNVLVFSGAPYPAIEICECLKFNMLFYPIAASSYSNHSEYVFDKTINNLPFVNADDFLDKFINVVQQYDIDYIIPTDDTIAVELTRQQSKIPANVVCSPYETALICRHKKMTYEVLAGEDYIPAVYQNDNVERFPVFAKPDDGQGSRGALRIDDKNALQTLSNIEKMVICEYLPGEEYTVDCFTDRNRKLVFCNPRIRSRLMNGITARGVNVPCTEEFTDIIESINNKIRFRGYWFAQLKRDAEGKLKLMELCCRFAGTFGVSKSLGANLPLMALLDASEMDCDALVNRYVVTSDKTYIDRYHIHFDYNTVYIDYDDTITFDHGEKINPYVMAFLFQCKNKGRKIVLLTRHSVDHNSSLFDDMLRHSIPISLFDKVYELGWDEEKTSFISDKNSIFIDNSFAERKKVYENCGIPVFDVANMDCLFDWR